MPAQKRPHEPTEEDNPQKENHEDPQGLYGSDSSSEENRDDEYVVIQLADIRKEVQCPICLGIIRKTRTVMECLHRFCRECIDKSMRLGNNECPACRTHCASRRSLRDDPNYDALIAAIYPDIDKYEEEEISLFEEEKVRNKQLQDSIAQTLRRQSEAQGKKGFRAKAKSTASMRRYQSNLRRSRRKNYLNDEPRGSDDNEDEEGINGINNSSSADEYCTELRLRRSKRGIGVHFSHPSGAGASGVGGCSQSDSEVDKECVGTTPAFFSGPERLTWGSSGLRSRVSNGKNGRKSRNSNLIDHLRNSEMNNDELVISLILVPLDAHELHKLQQLHVCCRPTLSVSQLCQYVSLHTTLETNDIEICTVQGLQPNLKLSTFRSSSTSDSLNIDPTKLKIQILQEQDTLAGIQATCSFTHGPLILAYQKKLQC